jgi:UTP--glucose-1-phosphate uridylyltransferase
VRSDAYVLTDDAHVAVSPERRLPGLPLVELDSEHFKLLRDFDARFPSGPPSLVECARLTVKGDVRFGEGVVVRGEVTVAQDGGEQRAIADGETLEA